MKLIIIFIFCLALFAQTPEEAAEEAYLANINTLLVFTSESGLSSGKYNFTKAGFNIKSISVPFRYQISTLSNKINLFVNGGVGYSITRLNDKQIQTMNAPSDINLTYDNKLQTYAGGLGIGMKYKNDFGIDFLASIGMIYSRVGISIVPQDDIGDAVVSFFDGKFNDNITYKVLLAVEYEKEIGGYTPYIKGTFKSYDTKADFTFNALSGFTTQSRVSILSLGSQTPPLLKYGQNFLNLEGYIKANFLHGDIKNVVLFDNYLNVGAVAYYNTPSTPFWASRFYTEVSTVRAEGLEGYNIGIGFTLDY
ncbi:hypothetical protein JHD50_12765 [Sulfurimonas sp. MAG313]|nr:hypothetical protein [Sulfurimonas sp. MAG313]MDF1882159.1 hypothetical protein [Sulfurimonas sp. MAG313]